jgi:hypothetical protein
MLVDRSEHVSRLWEDLRGIAIHDGGVTRARVDEDVLEECSRARALVRGPRETLVEPVERAGQAEELEVSSEPGTGGIIVAASAVFGLGSGEALRFAMRWSPNACEK